MNNLTTSMLDDEESVELFFSCRNLPNKDKFGKSDPLIFFYKNIEGNNWSLIGKTEVIKNDLNPDFAESFRLQFVFETRQKYKLHVLDIDNFTTFEGKFIGKAEFELADIIGSIHNRIILKLKDEEENTSKGRVVIRLDKIKEENKKNFFLKFQVLDVPKYSYFASYNSFIKIFKLRISDTLLEGMKNNDVKYDTLERKEWLNIYKSPNEKGKEPNFPDLEILGSKLCNNNFDIPLKIELWKHKSSGNHRLLGHSFFTINELVGQSFNYPFILKKQKNFNTSLQITHFKSEDVYDFVDFLKAGLNITLVLGVDMTASNKDPQDPSSLHYINPPNLNLYQQAIISVGEILQKYNHTRMIPAYGFGAKPEPNSPTSHFFPLNNNRASPWVNNVDELFNVYHQSCLKVKFAGPTYFAPILKEVVDYAEKRFVADHNNYTVFFLLTDGIVNDLQASIDEIVRGCFMPLSIIIVGIGNEDFKKMDILDADDVPLVSSAGETMERDIVQFVPFVEFKNNPIILREEVLDELPRQVRTFYKMKGIKPQDQPSFDFENLTENEDIPREDFVINSLYKRI